MSEELTTMNLETTPLPDVNELAHFDQEARVLSEGLGQELTALAIDRITRFYQPIVETLRFSRVILEAISDGALVFEPSGRIVLANSCSQRIFGLPPDIAGKTLASVPELAAVFDFVTGDAETGKAVIDEADT